MCDYKGQFDNMRTFHESWGAEEYGRIVSSLTKAKFTRMDEPLQAYDNMDNPLPSVSSSALTPLKFICLSSELILLISAEG